MLQSMTGYGQTIIGLAAGSLVWEIRTVNHRYQDISIRLPGDWRELELSVRSILREVFKRGKIDCTLRYQNENNQTTKFLVDTEVAETVIQAASQLEAIPSAVLRPMTVTDLLAWPGVVKPDMDTIETEKSLVLSTLRDVCEVVCERRASEGEVIQGLISARLDKLLGLVEQCREQLPKFQQLEQAKLQERYAELALAVDQERFEQEVVIMLQKTDVAEELDRLDAHAAEVKQVLLAGGGVGRRLDFLMQELNREANTLGSKAIHTDISNASVELKVLIEQMREQVQNLE